MPLLLVHGIYWVRVGLGLEDGGPSIGSTSPKLDGQLRALLDVSGLIINMTSTKHGL